MFLTITVISFYFLLRFATYHWKGLKEKYNFVVGNTSIKAHMKKLCSHKVSNTFSPRWNMVAPQGNCSPKHIVGP